MEDIKTIVYENSKEIIKNEDGITTTCDDKNKTITFCLTDKDKEILQNAITEKELDSNSIIKSNAGNFYVIGLSKKGSQFYLTFDDIAHLPTDKSDTNLDKFRSSDYNNLLIMGTDQKLKVSLQYKRILTEKEGHLSGNTWTFNHSLRPNSKFYFVLGLKQWRDDVWPFQIEMGSVPFQIGELIQAFVVDSVVSFKQISVISISLDYKSGIIVLKCNNFTQGEDTVDIYELETNLFDDGKQEDLEKERMRWSKQWLK